LVLQFPSACLSGRIGSLNDFGFTILDFGLGKNTHERNLFRASFRFLFRHSKIQNPKLVGIVAVVVTLAMGGAVAMAQQPTKLPRIGYLTGNPFSNSPARTEALRQGLRELGYEEAKNILIEWRSAEGKLDRFPALASELVNLKVDVIVTQGPIATPYRQERYHVDSDCHGF
jgi:hypothetical protein